MTRDELTDPTSTWAQQREQFHRARAVRLVGPGIAPVVMSVLLVAGVVPPPGGTADVLLWLVTGAAYAAFWLYLIRDARRFVDQAAALDERYRLLTGDPIPEPHALPFTPPSYPPLSPGAEGPVVAVAGRRIDARNAEVSRFPLASVGEVRERLGEWFARVRPSVVVTSAACGVDLLALDAAESLGIRRRVILPFDRGRFRHTSVTDRPGNWGRLYDRILGALDASDLIVLEHGMEGEAAYRAAADAVLDHAAVLASGRVPEDRDGSRSNQVIALIVWDGRIRDAGDLTVRFRDEAVRRSFAVDQLSTL